MSMPGSVIRFMLDNINLGERLPEQRRERLFRLAMKLRNGSPYAFRLAEQYDQGGNRRRAVACRGRLLILDAPSCAGMLGLQRVPCPIAARIASANTAYTVRMIRAGIDAIAHFTMNVTMLQNGMLTSTTLHEIGASLWLPLELSSPPPFPSSCITERTAYAGGWTGLVSDSVFSLGRSAPHLLQNVMDG